MINSFLHLRKAIRETSTNGIPTHACTIWVWALIKNNEIYIWKKKVAAHRIGIITVTPQAAIQRVIKSILFNTAFST